ncbi:leucine-rich repeat extensin-like protein 5 [Hibiscus syriacus]|uniref:leucine-rich repeat extensin-like protein 5 n=1 Tax=Hibiscus syriacus TaxID=106335 RepID=UPI0019218D50|nr:leucine-rich repeat extensin-like protein 5 [Hibiscus syriacus]
MEHRVRLLTMFMVVLGLTHFSTPVDAVLKVRMLSEYAPNPPPATRYHIGSPPTAVTSRDSSEYVPNPPLATRYHIGSPPMAVSASLLTRDLSNYAPNPSPATRYHIDSSPTAVMSSSLKGNLLKYVPSPPAPRANIGLPPAKVVRSSILFPKSLNFGMLPKGVSIPPSGPSRETSDPPPPPPPPMR